MIGGDRADHRDSTGPIDLILPDVLLVTDRYFPMGPSGFPDFAEQRGSSS